MMATPKVSSMTVSEPGIFVSDMRVEYHKRRADGICVEIPRCCSRAVQSLLVCVQFVRFVHGWGRRACRLCGEAGSAVV